MTEKQKVITDKVAQFAREHGRMKAALERIARIEANRFPDNKTWKDLASEAINIARVALAPEGDETLTIKKT